MNPVTKVALVIGIAGAAATAAIVHADELARRQDTADLSAVTRTAFAERKDDSRIAMPAAAEKHKGNFLTELAQAAPVQKSQGLQVSQADGPPPGLPPFGPPRPPHGPGAWPHHPPGMEPPPPPGPMTRSACEDRIDREVARAAFFKSKLRLQPKQREAWQKIEEAAQPAIDRLHAACDRLPVDVAAGLSLPDMIDAVQGQLSARAELLQAVREPLRALFETLSPEQRMTLRPPLPPMHPR